MQSYSVSPTAALNAAWADSRLARGKTEELRDELRQSNDRRDKGFLRKKTALKKIVANMTMGNDSAYILRRTRSQWPALPPASLALASETME